MRKIKDLRKYQVTGYEYILEKPFCGLFLDMGLGKTATTLTAIHYLKRAYFEVEKVLVVAPKRVAETVWSDELAEWEHTRTLRMSRIIGDAKARRKALSVDADIYVVSRDNLQWLVEELGDSIPFDMLVIDELSSFKNPKAKRFKALRKLRPVIKRVVGLTGTPAANSLLDLWAPLYLLDRGERLGKYITGYRDKYFMPTKYVGNVPVKYALREGSEETIRNKISDICLSMKASDYLSLPPVIHNHIRLELEPKLQKEYRDFEREKILEVASKEDSITVAHAGALANKLLQFSNGAVYDEEHVAHEVHNLKIDALRDILEEACGQSVLVAWTFQSDRDRIMAALADYSPRELKNEEDIKAWNNGEVQLMLVHPASAGHGLNLQKGGHIIVWFGLTWSLELYQQFNARLARQGQTCSVIVHHILVKGTYDENVLKALTYKDENQEALLEGLRERIKEAKKNLEVQK